MTNFLGYACPDCGCTDSIDVAASVWVRLTDDGTDANCGDHEYDPTSLAKCAGCGHQGKFETFDPTPKPPSLEDALKQALTALNTARRFKVPALSSDSYRIATLCEAALAAVKEG